jgi:hypothetical protein
MKKLMILITLFSLILSANGQTLSDSVKFEFDEGSIYANVDADTINLLRVFALMDAVLPVTAKHYDRYIRTRLHTYYRPGIGVFCKPRIYELKGGKLIRIKEQKSKSNKKSKNH